MYPGAAIASPGAYVDGGGGLNDAQLDQVTLDTPRDRAYSDGDHALIGQDVG